MTLSVPTQSENQRRSATGTTHQRVSMPVRTLRPRQMPPISAPRTRKLTRSSATRGQIAKSKPKRSRTASATVCFEMAARRPDISMRKIRQTVPRTMLQIRP